MSFAARFMEKMAEVFFRRQPAQKELNTKSEGVGGAASSSPQQPMKPEDPQEKEREIQEEKEDLTRRGMQVLYGKVLDKVPDEGPFERVGVCFYYPGTRNIARIDVECDILDASKRRLITRSFREGTDLCVNHFREKGSKEEILAYLADESHCPELMESFQQLSDSVDDHW